MMNVIADKVEWCKQFGITIQPEKWNCNQLPATLVTDMGAEYKSDTFEQISELGVKVVNLPPYRPELKGSVEKFFDLIQGSYKKHLKGKGVVEPDYQERGVRDYRKDACLTLTDFEKIILRCILYYNSERIVEKFPYTETMIREKVRPYANCIYEWGKSQIGANLISVDTRQLIFVLLPRTEGTFTRFGLKVNKMRYKNDDFTEKYLNGGTVTVAYNPENVSSVWLIEDGTYIQFELIESRYKGKLLTEVQSIQSEQKQIKKEEKENNLQALISLAEHIQAIANSIVNHGEASIKNVRDTRKREQVKKHIDYIKDGAIDG